MAFPALTPAVRTWTPGDYVNALSVGINGKQGNVRLTNAIKASELQLQFVALTYAELTSLVQHYLGQQGSYQAFGVASETWAGVSNANDYVLPGYLWRYAESPQVEDYPADDQTRFSVSIKLTSVPAEGTALIGTQFLVRASLAPGTAGASNGASLSAVVSFAPGSPRFIPGGLTATVPVSLKPGWPLNNGALFGLTASVAVAFSGGRATGDNVSVTSDYWSDWVMQTYEWESEVYIDWWGS